MITSKKVKGRKTDSAIELYYHALKYVQESGLHSEIQAHDNMEFMNFNESDLLRESSWVILCSGFREKTVREKFDYISLCFYDWESAKLISNNSSQCINSVIDIFSNSKKLNAIVSVAKDVDEFGFENIKKAIISNPIEELRRFSYIGPITSFHLAKNLGFDVAKPDRHLARISRKIGYHDVHEMCRDINRKTGVAVKVIDLLIWRYLADNNGHHIAGHQQNLDTH